MAGHTNDISSAYSFIAVTPSDVTNMPGGARGLYVGGAGNVAVVASDDTIGTFIAVPVGTILPVQFKRINATNTTATNLIALY